MANGEIKYGVFEWRYNCGCLRFTAASFRDDDDISGPRLLQTCRTWQAATRIANRLNLEATKEQKMTPEEANALRTI